MYLADESVHLNLLLHHPIQDLDCHWKMLDCISSVSHSSSLQTLQRRKPIVYVIKKAAFSCLTLWEVLHYLNHILLGEQQQITVSLGPHCNSTWNIMNQVYLLVMHDIQVIFTDAQNSTSPNRLPSFITATTSPSPESTCTYTQRCRHHSLYQNV